jgi:hypothetical protein
MKSKQIALSLTLGTALVMALPTTGYAQTTTIITPVPVTAPVTAEQHVLPNPPLLASGLTGLVVGYLPALGVAIASDHKGDDELFIPVAGPWLDLGKRSCSGVTVATADGPYEVASQKNCGSSGIETAALIADGAVQGLGALQVIGSFFIPERRLVSTSKTHAPRFAVVPTSFAGHGAGAVATGNF